MDSFEWTKIAGAILAALLLIFAFKTLIEVRQDHAAETGPGYTLPGGEPPAAPAKEAAAKGKDAAPAAAPAKEAAAAPAIDAPAAPAKHRIMRLIQKR